MIGPEPSSTVIERMHIASTRQRIESAVYGRLKNSSAESGLNIRSSALGDMTIRAGIVRAALVEEPVVLERGVEVGLAVEDRDRDVVADLEECLELVGGADR